MEQHAYGIGVLAVLTAMLLAEPASGQTPREAEGARLLRGAIDMHFHIDAPSPMGSGNAGSIATLKQARSHGMRGLVAKSHYEPTATLAHHVRLEMPDFELFGGIVLDRTNGGINLAAVEYMAQIRGGAGKVVWMPVYDSEIVSQTSKQANRPFVSVSRNGELLPEVKAVISAIAKNGLVLASGHIAPVEALMVLREGRSQGVRHMLATHAMDLAGKMTMEQMLEAVQLGAMIEFDFRNILDEGGRAEAIRKLGPEHCIISEFWTKTQPPREYGALEGVGAFVEAMRSRGFTDRELDLMFKDNPARVLGLTSH